MIIDPSIYKFVVDRDDKDYLCLILGKYEHCIDFKYIEDGKEHTFEIWRKKRLYMTKGETIAYAIRKECCRVSLVEWCKGWGFTIEEFLEFLSPGQEAFDEKHREETHNEDIKEE